MSGNQNENQVIWNELDDIEDIEVSFVTYIVISTKQSYSNSRFCLIS